ncbi:hypothetical protein JMJ77_0000450 [Colletotrichum scovillei]|uniref:Uncharacterized protein n=1 Tax=Colletotrichum scovillei TaxID=1209932 RepID=A0A9P7R9M1_9PEZI|nr:hypothetical protein JMJ77_0000450 [Colletotrichum scovillei]KAG7071655.1 hypothetical protein JMJ76_0004525 [Colletotrichum scovillei]KAG7079935.1 hypothetical protein JMJ78_0007038 [Colletotrichum scovillei]
MSVSALRTGQGDHGTAPLALYAILHDLLSGTVFRDPLGLLSSSSRDHLPNLAFSLNPARLLARHLKLVEPAQGPLRPIIRRLPRCRTSCRILH